MAEFEEKPDQEEELTIRYPLVIKKELWEEFKKYITREKHLNEWAVDAIVAFTKARKKLK